MHIYIKCYFYFLIFKVVLFMVDILINTEFHCHQTKFLQRCKPYQQPSYQDLLRHSYQKLLRRLDPHLDSMWLMRSVCLLAVHARARLLIALNPQWAILSFFWMVTKVIWRTQRKTFHCLTTILFLKHDHGDFLLLEKWASICYSLHHDFLTSVVCLLKTFFKYVVLQ